MKFEKVKKFAIFLLTLWIIWFCIVSFYYEHIINNIGVLGFVIIQIVLIVISIITYCLGPPEWRLYT